MKYEILNIFFNFFGLIRVDRSWPIKPKTRSLSQVNIRTRFNNYTQKYSKPFKIIIFSFELSHNEVVFGKKKKNNLAFALVSIW
jgi:hypothetical protein